MIEIPGARTVRTHGPDRPALSTALSAFLLPFQPPFNSGLPVVGLHTFAQETQRAGELPARA